jgi:predicted acyltransferase
LAIDIQNKSIVEYPFQNSDNTQPKLNRIPSLDILRGIALILLTLNTTLVFLYKVPNRLNFFEFFTFWLTSLCFPVFAFLVGVTIYYRQFNKPKIKVFLYCLILGPLYIFLDVVLISFGAWALS